MKPNIEMKESELKVFSISVSHICFLTLVPYLFRLPCKLEIALKFVFSVELNLASLDFGTFTIVKLQTFAPFNKRFEKKMKTNENI